MTLLEESKKKVWYWQNKPIPLGKLQDSQLYSIHETLKKSKSDWFGQSRESWLNAIKPIIKERQQQTINSILQNKENRLKADVYKISDKIMSHFK